MAQALILAALVWSGHIQLWHIYVLAVMLGVANAFEQPTRQAFVVEMVGRDDLMNAVTLNSGLFNTARLLGPAIGGFVIATVGVKVAFLLNGISFIPVIIGLLMMSMADLYGQAKTRAAGRVNPLAEIREGLQYAFRTPSALLIVILVAIVGTFGYNFTVILPLVDKYVLNRGAAGLGFLTAAVGLGALISALSLASRKSATKYTLFMGGGAFALLARRGGVQSVVLRDAAVPAAARRREHRIRGDCEHVAAARDARPPARAGDGAVHAALRRLDADRRLPDGVHGGPPRRADGDRHRGGRVHDRGCAIGLLYYVSHREKVIATSDIMHASA